MTSVIIVWTGLIIFSLLMNLHYYVFGILNYTILSFVFYIFWLSKSLELSNSEESFNSYLQIMVINTFTFIATSMLHGIYVNQGSVKMSNTLEHRRG